MEMQIDIEDETPLFTQVMEQIKLAVGQDALSPGAALPSIRQLSNDLEVNSKTVAKAYQLLERDQIIQTKGYRGTFVHPRAKDNISVDLKDRALIELTKTIDALKDANLTDSEIRNAFALAMSPPPKKGT